MKGEQEDEGEASHASQENGLGVWSNRDLTGGQKTGEPAVAGSPVKEIRNLTRREE